MMPRLLPIITCGDCIHFDQVWKGARCVRICGRLGRVVCTWMTPRPPIPTWCQLEKAAPEIGDASLVVSVAEYERLRDD